MKKLGVIITIIFVLFGAVFLYKHNINKIKGNSKEEVNIQKKTNEMVESFNGKPLIYNNSSIPVLMYHSIDYEQGNELRVPKEKFDEQMKFLKDNGYTTLSLEELHSFFKDNKPVPEKSIVITLDDGYIDNYLNAYPILKKYEFIATVFVITSTIDNNNKCLNSIQLKEMEAEGIDIESHTVNHEELAGLSYEKQLNTLKESKDHIEKLLNKKVYYIAYPVGKWNSETLRATKEAGYKMAFTTKNSTSNKSNGLFTLNRIRISASCNINQFKKLIEQK